MILQRRLLVVNNRPLVDDIESGFQLLIENMDDDPRTHVRVDALASDWNLPHPVTHVIMEI